MRFWQAGHSSWLAALSRQPAGTQQRIIVTLLSSGLPASHSWPPPPPPPPPPHPPCLQIDDLKQFRQWGSKTPGHPENFLTAGIEVTTGPLGAGVANAVGIAAAEANLAARYNKPGMTLVDHYTYVIMGDGEARGGEGRAVLRSRGAWPPGGGCLQVCADVPPSPCPPAPPVSAPPGCNMEGISSEAASIAGHWGLGKLIALYDDNRISIDGHTDISFTEDVAARYAAQGWHVQHVKDGNHDLEGLHAAIAKAKVRAAAVLLLGVLLLAGGLAACAGRQQRPPFRELMPHTSPPCPPTAARPPPCAPPLSCCRRSPTSPR